MIRKERAEFLDNVLKLFDGNRTVRKKDLEIKYKDDTYTYYQTEKHLKVLENDGLISSSPLDEYYLQPQGLKVLNDIENIGYLAKHKIAAAKYQEDEDEGEDGEPFGTYGIVEIAFTVFSAFQIPSK